MVDATISRVRMRELARLGRFRPGYGWRSRPPPGLRFAEPAAHRCWQHRQASVSTPQTHQLAPRSGDLMASPI